MSIRQTLLHVTTFPDPAPESFLEGAVTVATLLKSGLTVEVPQLDSDPATWRPVMGGFVADYYKIMGDIAADSERNAHQVSETLTRLCRRAKVALDLRRSLIRYDAPMSGTIELARLRDLVILQAPGPETLDHRLLHAAIFQTGRPVMLLPLAPLPLRAIERIVVAWDFSREAARALKDALPLLAQASDIHLVSVEGEKTIATTTTVTDLEKYLGAHGVSFSIHRQELQGATVAESLMLYADAIGADLLVMGAFGHSRTTEFILGGATRGMLRNPLLPILLSH